MQQGRARPTAQLMERLYRSKAALHARRARMPLRQKVAATLELQRVYLPLLERHRPLAPWEHPWAVEP
jgi:hypothetical protein